MHRFKCKVRGGQPTPIELNKQDFFKRVLADYEQRNITVTVTLEVAEKKINNEQGKLYTAFIVKAADHFGNNFHEMQGLLKEFWPEGRNPKEWTSNELDKFIHRALSHLAEFGFHF